MCLDLKSHVTLRKCVSCQSCWTGWKCSVLKSTTNKCDRTVLRCNSVIISFLRSVWCYIVRSTFFCSFPTTLQSKSSFLFLYNDQNKHNYNYNYNNTLRLILDQNWVQLCSKGIMLNQNNFCFKFDVWHNLLTSCLLSELENAYFLWVKSILVTLVCLKNNNPKQTSYLT